MTNDVLEKMLEQAQQEYPLECCGLLSGRGKLIDGIQSTKNQLQSRRGFFVPPAELLAFMKAVRHAQREFLGIYHSHPDGSPYPSQRDVEQFHYPGVSYWIVAMKPGEARARCFKWETTEFKADSFDVIRPQEVPKEFGSQA